MRPVKLRQHLIDRITHCHEMHWPFTGKAYRTDTTITLVLPGPGRGKMTLETRRLVVVERAEDEWVPVAWQYAARRYCRRWPGSAEGVVAFAALSQRERKAHIATELRRAADRMEKHTIDTPPAELADDLTFLLVELLPWIGDYRVSEVLP